jgi:Spy/CpxP family protein refolding chaperone
VAVEYRRSLRRLLDAADRDVADALRREVTDLQIEALVDRAETIRMRRNVARTMLLFRMYRTLTPHQRRLLSIIRSGSAP